MEETHAKKGKAKGRKLQAAGKHRTGAQDRRRGSTASPSRNSKRTASKAPVVTTTSPELPGNAEMSREDFDAFFGVSKHPYRQFAIWLVVGFGGALVFFWYLGAFK